ncbi:hypothetical protein Hypma_008404 [Hypsizygus marmoreus]|uniref:F-box domain-containing protein n=1 Tax=Hypsizygus marmoreus TaxID=39966 RepID=A0A369JY46_HYPMA|nr:hypothetical protein Hypma_008404 [Hypsizygus marmoreus]
MSLPKIAQKIYVAPEDVASAKVRVWRPRHGRTMFFTFQVNSRLWRIVALSIAGMLAKANWSVHSSGAAGHAKRVASLLMSRDVPQMSRNVAIAAPLQQICNASKNGFNRPYCFAHPVQFSHPTGRATMNMNLCPPEIHSLICELACLDDGRTVRALSLVSKYFYEIACPYFYQSIALSGSHNITALAFKLENIPPHLRLIRHLFISSEPVEKCDRKLEKIAPSSESMVLLRVLALAAPTLETLSFVHTSPAVSTPIISRLFRLSFPNLRELAVSGFYPFPSSPGKMPVLERLHLHGNRNPHGLLQMGGLDQAFSSLTHLRISGLNMAVSFALELQEALSGESRSPFPSKFPARVRRVIVQPGPPLLASAKPTASHTRDQLMMAQLAVLRPSRVVDFSVLPRSETPGSFRQDWLDRLGGAEGFWAR